MITIVVDTNVLLAACLKEEGASRTLVKRCLTGQYRPLIGTALFLEYEDIMNRDTLFDRCPLTAKERGEVFRGFLAVCRWTEVYYAWRPNLPDESDNHLFELAVAGRADALITRNLKDLTRGELRFPSIKILSPEQCLEVYS